jgi:hypothetical protein
MNTTGQQAKRKVWLVLTFGEDRQYAGNTGYDDDPGKWYSYDSYVANHRQISEGHCVILCDRRRALGIARITKIDEEPSTRLLQRCPVCKSTGIKIRRTKQPEYRCNDGHEFDQPIKENAPCTKYTAQFGGTFTPFTDDFGRDFLRQGCPRYSDQLAMQEFDFSRIERVLRDSFPTTVNILTRWISDTTLSPDAADDEQMKPASYTPTDSDYRERLLRQIRARRGQQAFRDTLRKRYGDQCMMSGCGVLHVLEAAHICPYRGASDNHAENGLLLRADLHTLFDLDLIGIEPSTLTIHVHPAIKCYGYERIEGKTLCSSGRTRPSEEALTTRWEIFKAGADG